VFHFEKTEAKACATLMRDWERLIAFYDYPPSASWSRPLIKYD
jgi:hypothetical protein